MSDPTPSSTRAPRALDGLLGGLVDRCNPILVKEVRQALRGRFFRIAFLCVLVAATFVASAVILNTGPDLSVSDGRNYMMFLYFCLSLAVCGLVPFTAFNAMGAEWDENTFDLLVLSRLRPRNIVFGKLLGAQVQALLYLATFTPFLVLGTLMRGIDPRGVLVLLGFTLVYSATATCGALMLSSLTRVRFARVVLMALLAGLLMIGIASSMNAAQNILRRPGDLFTGEGQAVMAGLVGAFALCGLLFSCVASNMLSHPEENRSTNLRVLASVTLVLCGGYVVVMSAIWGVSRDLPEVTSALGFAVVFFVSLFLVTEREGLGVRVRTQVPRHSGTALLAAPWLPGGGRGALWFFLHAGLVFLYVVLLQAVATRSLNFGATYLMLLGLTLYATVYLLLPSLLMMGGSDQPRIRVLTRAVIPVSFLMLLFLPALFGFFIGSDRMMELRHPGNPFWLMIEAWEGQSGRMLGTWAIVGLAALVTLLLNAPRLVRSLQEVEDARSDRAAAALAALHPAPAEGPVEDLAAGSDPDRDASDGARPGSSSAGPPAGA